MAPHNIPLDLVFDKVWLLHWKLKIDAVDGNPGQPGQPPGAFVEVTLGTLLRELSTRVSDRAFAERLAGAGKEMAVRGAGGLVSGWEVGDDICPPWRWPWPPRGNGKPQPDPWFERLTVFGPSPEPWMEHLGGRMQDVVVAHAVRWIASLSTNEELAPRVRDIAMRLGDGFIGAEFDDFCGTVPRRPPIPGPVRS